MRIDFGKIKIVENYTMDFFKSMSMMDEREVYIKRLLTEVKESKDAITLLKVKFRS